MTNPLTEYDIQSALIAYYKSQPTITSLLLGPTGTEIRENQWQGTAFEYPAIRVYVDVYPSVNGCGPDRAEICTEVFSAQKSSKESKLISAAIVKLLHKKIFTSNGLKFFMVRIVKEWRSERSIFAWITKIDIEALIY
jgi:hypothetical protein